MISIRRSSVERSPPFASGWCCLTSALYFTLTSSSVAPGPGIGPHLPGRTMARQRILLIARDRLVVHAGKEIIRVVIFAHMVEAEMPILPRVVPALRRT